MGNCTERIDGDRQMMMFTKWHDKVLAVVVIAFMAWFTGATMYSVYEDVKEQNYKERMLKERDPLTLYSTDTDMQILPCGGTLELPRYTEITKPLQVTVQRKIIKIGKNIVDQETTHLPDITYTDANVGGRHITYTMITPRTLVDGMYLYVPTLTYKVNKYLTINKPAASQVFTVKREKGCKS